MDWPYEFPNPGDEIARQGAATQALPFEARLDRLFDLIASGQALAAGFPRSDAHRRLKDRSEAAWRQAHREVIDRHAG